MTRVGEADGSTDGLGSRVVAGGRKTRRLSQQVVQPRFLGRGAGAAARLGLGTALGGVRPARRSVIVARVVICSGLVRNSISAGLPDSTARLNAGENSSVVVTTSPWPPNASMYLQKSGLVRVVPDT